MNKQAAQRIEDADYKFKLSMVKFDMDTAKWWQKLAPEEQMKFVRIRAESEYAAEVQIAAEFGRIPEPIEEKIKRIISKYDSLAKKYPL